MKKTSIAIMSAVLAVLIAMCGFLYFAKYKPNIQKQPNLDNVYVPKNFDESLKGKKVLLAELKEDDFKLYSAGENIVIEHAGEEVEFKGLGKNLPKEEPSMYYNDFDRDGKKELVIRILKDVDDATKEKVYVLAIISINKDKSGKLEYDINYIERDDWYNLFNQTFKPSINQPKSYNNRLQLAISTKNESIKYDSKTGLALNGKVAFVRSLLDNQGEYQKYKGWEKGPGVFVVDNDKKQIGVDVSIYAVYEGVAKKQKVGTVKVGLDIKNNSVAIDNKSIEFIPNSEYITTNPNDVEKDNWQTALNNTASVGAKKDAIIDKISINCQLNNKNGEQEVSFSSKNEDSAVVEKVVLDNNSIKLYAKDGYNFAKTKITSRGYSAIIKIGDLDCDVSYSASVEKENDKNVLVYKLDKSYSFEQLKNVHIKFGV